MTPGVRLKKCVLVIGGLSLVLLVLTVVTALAASTAEARATASTSSASSSTPTDNDMVSCTTSWTNASGGSWHTASNWSTGLVPGVADDVCITLDGDYAVTMFGASTTVHSLTVGGAIGTQRLKIGSTSAAHGYLATTTGTTVGNQGEIELTNGDAYGYNATLAGPVSNAGTILSSTGAGGTRYLQGNLTNTGTLLVNQITRFDVNGTLFQNNGTVAIADGVYLYVLGGASFTNAGGSLGATSPGGDGYLYQAGGTFTQGGGTTIGTKPVYVDNGNLRYTGSGASAVTLRQTSTLGGDMAADQTLSIESICSTHAYATAAAGFTNAGTIILTNGDSCGNYVYLTFSSGTLTNSGTIRTQLANGGTRYLQGNLNNTGSLLVNASTSYNMAGTALVNSGTVAIADGAALSVVSGASFTNAGGSVGATAPTGSGYLYQAGGTFTQSAGATTGTKPIVLQSVALSYTGDGASCIALRAASTLSGNMAAGQALNIESMNQVAADVTVAAGFSNAGTMVLTNGDGAAYHVYLTVASGGTLTNTGTIRTLQSAGGVGSLSGNLVNSGLLQLNTATSLQGNLTNTGSLQVNANTTYNGAHTLLNQGAISIADGVYLSAPGAPSIVNDAGGSIVASGATANGYLGQVGGTFTQGGGATSGGRPVIVQAATLNYTGDGNSKVALRGASTLTGNMVAGQTLSLESVNNLNADVTAAAGFTNAGTIVLTNGDASASRVNLIVPIGATLANTGTIRTEPGVGGTRNILGNLTNSGILQFNTATSLQANLTNTGSLQVNANTTNNGAYTLLNQGAISIADGVYLSIVGGATVVNDVGGSIVASGPTANGYLSQVGGTFTQGGGTTSGRRPVIVQAVTLNYTGDGASKIALRGESTLTGNLMDGQTLNLESVNLLNATVTAAAGFTNGGTIVLTNGDATAYHVLLRTPSGTMTNAGTIQSEPAIGGTRTLQGNLINSGSLLINATTTYNQSGTTLVNSGTVAVANGAYLSVASGASFNNAGGTIGATSPTGSGYVYQAGGTFTQGGGTTIGTKPVYVDSATLSYTGSGASYITLRRASTLSGNMVAGQTLSLESLNGLNAEVTVAAGFSNGGTIVLTNGGAFAYHVNLLVATGATVTNTGTIRTEPGVGGTRNILGNLTNSGILQFNTATYLRGNLTNTGSVQVNAVTSYLGANTLLNQGAITIADGVYLFAPDAPTVINDLGGSIVASGSSGDGYHFQVGGSFTQGAGTTAGSRPVILQDLTLNYTGSGESTLALRGQVSLHGQNAPGQIMRIESSCARYDAIILAPPSYVNEGTIVLTNGDSCAYSVHFFTSDWSLINRGTIRTLASAGGHRNFDVALFNEGTVFLDTGSMLEVSSIWQTSTGILRSQVQDAQIYGRLLALGGGEYGGTVELVRPPDYVPNATFGTSFMVCMTAGVLDNDPDTGYGCRGRSLMSNRWDKVAHGAINDTGLYFLPTYSGQFGDWLSAAQATLGVSSPIAVRGESLSISGNDWPADDSVLITFTDQSGAKMTYPSVSTTPPTLYVFRGQTEYEWIGSFSSSVTIPVTATAGVGTLTVVSNMTGATMSATVDVRSTAPAPDLTPSSFTGPAGGKPGQSIPISWTVTNQGEAQAAPTWYDRVYLSTDNTWDAADVLVTNVTRTLTLTVGSSYTVTQNVAVPWVSPGQYYLLLRTDMWGSLAESDEANNVRTVPFIVGTPDLTPTAFTAPTSAAGWQTIPLTWTIKNQGARDAVPSWQDRVYLSTDNAYDAGDTWLTTVTHTDVLMAGDSYTVTQNVVVPNVTTGGYYLILLTDMWNQVPETNEANNVRAVFIYVGPPDLTPTALLAPSRAEVGTSVPITWTVKNQGVTQARPTWYDRVYLSSDSTWDGGDVLLTNLTHTVALAPWTSYTETLTVTVPWVSAGNYYLIVRTDVWGNVGESDETNNLRAVPIAVGIPDLVPTAFTGPSAVKAWQSITPTWSVKNLGHGDANPSWQDRIYLSTDTTYESGDTWLTTVAHGVTLTHNSSYTVTQSLVMPNVTPGNYYLILKTEMWNAVSELDETNNVRALPISVGPPDLTPTEFVTPAVVKPGASIPLTWTVKNQGYTDVLPTWYDRVYLSTDMTYDSGDVFMTNVTRTFTLLPGTSYTTSRMVNLPRYAPGTYYLIFKTDMWNGVTELDESNNQLVVPITLALPDLTPTAFTAPATGQPWQTVPVTFTIRNQGPVDAMPSWEDRVYLSTNATWESGDTFLAKVTHSALVAAGDSYTVSTNVTLGEPGTYYLILRTDVWGQVAEQDETNNSTVVGIVVAP